MASPRTRKAFAEAEKQAVAKMTEAVRSFALKLYSDVIAAELKVHITFPAHQSLQLKHAFTRHDNLLLGHFLTIKLDL